MGAKSRRKGAEAEREVVALAIEHGFLRAKRLAPMQAGSGDDDRFPDVGDVGRLWVEVKRRGKGSMYALAVDACQERPGFIPTLAYREDHGPWLAVVPLTELLKLERDAKRDVQGDCPCGKPLRADGRCPDEVKLHTLEDDLSVLPSSDEEAA